MATNTVTNEPIRGRLSALIPPLKVNDEQHALLHHAASDCCDLLAEVVKRVDEGNNRVTYSLALRAEMLSNLILAMVGGGDEGCVEHYGVASFGHLFKAPGASNG